MREDLDIYDRVGGGDGFATGLTWGFLDGRDAAGGGRDRRRPRRADDDHPGRHLDDDQGRGAARGHGQGRPGRPMSEIDRAPGHHLEPHPRLGAHGGRGAALRGAASRACASAGRSARCRSSPTSRWPSWARSYDLLVIDHPWAGFAADSGVLMAMEDVVSADFLADQAANSVGPSLRELPLRRAAVGAAHRRRHAGGLVATGPARAGTARPCPRPGRSCWRWPGGAWWSCPASRRTRS